MPEFATCGPSLSAPGSQSFTVASPELNAIIDAIARKQQAALGRLYSLAASRVFGIAYVILASKEDAEEIVSDTFMYVWEHARHFNGQRGSVMGWLNIITRNRTIDRLRRRRQPSSIDDDCFVSPQTSWIAEDNDPEEAMIQHQNYKAVHDAMAALPPVRHKLVRLSFFLDFTHREIGAALAIPQGTVKSHVRRGVLALRASLTRRDSLPCSHNSAVDSYPRRPRKPMRSAASPDIAPLSARTIAQAPSQHRGLGLGPSVHSPLPGIAADRLHEANLEGFRNVPLSFLSTTTSELEMR